MTEQTAFRLDLSSLKKQLGDATYARAREVYVTQRVREGYEVFQSGSQDWHLIGIVQGSNRELYEVDVDVEVTPWGEISSLSSECTCPVGSRCKHAGALLLKAAYQAKGVVSGAPPAAAPKFPSLPPKTPVQKQDREIENWLSLFQESDEQDVIVPGQPLGMASEERGSGQDRIVFLLFERIKAGTPTLYISAKISKKKVHGGWGKPRAISYSSELGKEDLEVLQLIRTLGRGGSYYAYGDVSEAVLAGSAGMLALQLAAQTKHLFESTDGSNVGAALELGEDRAIEWRWRETITSQTKQVAWQLSARVADTDEQTPALDQASDPAQTTAPTKIFLNEPALYWDDREHKVGKIASAGIDAQRLASLLRSPPIPQSAWTAHEQTMLRHLAGLPLPPFAKAPHEIKGISPRACLVVHQLEPEQHARYGLMALKLRFAYGPVNYFSIRLGSPQLIHAADFVEPGQLPGVERVLLHRDLEAETQYINVLHQQGMQGNVGGEFYLPPQGFQGQAPDPWKWVRWVDERFDVFLKAGFEVSLPPELLNWVTEAKDLQVKLQAGGQIAAKQSANQESAAENDLPAIDAAAPWFDLSLGIEVGGERVNILPVLPALIEQVRLLRAIGAHQDASQQMQLPEFMFVPRGKGWLKLPTEPLKPWLAALMELLDPDAKIKGESLRLSRFDALRLGASLGENVPWQGASGLRQLLAQLKGGVNALSVPLLPEGLRAELRPYQLQGLAWLQFLREQQLAGVLADDMGLGKTLQTLAHVLLEKEQGRLNAPALIVTPVSLLGNWQREAARFTPSLRTLVLHGSARHEVTQEIQNADVVLTSYSLLARDRELWVKQPWSLLVLDEAQYIKNASTDVAQAAYDLPAGQRLCLSGTPMENHLGELWSLFHFLMPGFLGSQRRFKELYRTPIEKHGDTELLSQLSRRVTPFILRRTKKVVAQDLPDKIETLSTVRLEGKQADLYETIRLATEKAVREALHTRGLAKSQIQVLDALLKLRQVCCDPRLVPTDSARKVKQSAKLEHLMDILPEMLAEGRRVLLFSQFTSMLELIEQELAKHKIEWVKLTGQSKKRDEIIERFTSGQVPLFLISLKAGGVGLNLPQADTVIHYDPWWNPAVENQATDRAHRIGQTSQVFVYKLVASGTIEERMLGLQERKAQLAQGMLSGAQARKEALFTEDDVAQLLRPLGE